MSKRNVGRPKMPMNKRRVDFNTTIAPETKDYLNAESERLGVSLGFIIDSLVEMEKIKNEYKKP